LKKIKTSLANLKNDLNQFYNKKEWSFLTLNALMIDSKQIEIQWIFSKYNSIDDVVIFFATTTKDDIVPSVVDIIPSATISQRELVDMFGIKIEDSEKGLYLDDDSLSAPLLSCGI
jgi:NADH:ubiquinone oxidoreductase subunit C